MRPSIFQSLTGIIFRTWQSHSKNMYTNAVRVFHTRYATITAFQKLQSVPKLLVFRRFRYIISKFYRFSVSSVWVDRLLSSYVFCDLHHFLCSTRLGVFCSFPISVHPLYTFLPTSSSVWHYLYCSRSILAVQNFPIPRCILFAEGLTVRVQFKWGAIHLYEFLGSVPDRFWYT